MSSETTTRRDRVVMALGICALLLFAANLVTMVKKHFFNDHRTEHTVVVHQMHRMPRAHVVVRPNLERQIRIVTEHSMRTAELMAVKARLLEETERLTREAARLAEAGHTDASMSLQQTVETTLVRLQHLEQELAVLAERDIEIDAPDTDFHFEVRSEPAVDVQVEVIEPSSN